MKSIFTDCRYEVDLPMERLFIWHEIPGGFFYVLRLFGLSIELYSSMVCRNTELTLSAWMGDLLSCHGHYNVRRVVYTVTEHKTSSIVSL